MPRQHLVDRIEQVGLGRYQRRDGGAAAEIRAGAVVLIVVVFLQRRLRAIRVPVVVAIEELTPGVRIVFVVRTGVGIMVRIFEPVEPRPPQMGIPGLEGGVPGGVGGPAPLRAQK